MHVNHHGNREPRELLGTRRLARDERCHGYGRSLPNRITRGPKPWAGSEHDQKNQKHPLLDHVDSDLQPLSNRNAVDAPISVETSENPPNASFQSGPIF
jgi:hypothetical protein